MKGMMKDMQMEAPQRPKPMMSVHEDDMPEIKNAKVGRMMNISAKLKVKGMRQGGDGKMCADCEVMEMKDKAFKDKNYKDLIEESMNEEHAED